MLFESIVLSIRQLFTPSFRSALWKSLGLTLAMLIGLWFLLEALFSTLLLPFLGPWPWLTTALGWLLGTGLVVGLGFLVAPVMSLFAGLFLDDIAEAVEETHYPDDTPGQPVPIGKSLAITLKFFGLVLGANLIALCLVLFLGLGLVIFFVVNGYLLGREYFQFASMRHTGIEGSEALRQRHSLTIFLAGLAIAGVLSIPIANLFAPLFAGALMTHVYKQVAGGSALHAEQ